MDRSEGHPLWVPSSGKIQVYKQGTHKGCPYGPGFSTSRLNAYEVGVFCKGHYVVIQCDGSSAVWCAADLLFCAGEML